MTLTEISQLSAESRAIAEDYLEAARASLCGVERELAEDVVEGLESHFLERLSPESMPGEIEAVIAELGEPDEMAAALCALGAPSEAPVAKREPGTGVLLGMPWDLRPPTAERVASRWWDPREPRVFVPKVFGWGWGVNFGALAVRMRWIEPDAEEGAFEHVSDRAFLGWLLVPVSVCAAMLGSYLALSAPLPDRLPTHWDIAGNPDNFASAPIAFGMLLAIALAPTLWAVWSVATRRRPLTRGATIGAASFGSALAGVIWVLTILSGFGTSTPGWLFFVAIVAALVVPLLVLTGLARAGRAAEIRADLDRRKASTPGVR